MSDEYFVEHPSADVSTNIYASYALPDAIMRRRLHPYVKHLLVALGIVLIASAVAWKCNFHRNGVTLTSKSTGFVAAGNETIAQLLEREVRVLCWVMTTPANHKTKAIHVLRTWGKRCNRIVFVTSQEDDELNTIVLSVEDKYENLWGKTREAFRYIHQHYNDEADWFMKADDDTYVFVENLRYMLYAYSPEMPIYFGYNFKLYGVKDESYMSGGSGYVLSKEALRRFVETSFNESDYKCRINENNGAEDVEMGLCLYEAGVLAGDSRDINHKNRFLPFEPHAALIANHYGKDFWIYGHSHYHVRNCRDCLSNYAIAFHYVHPDDMYMYDYFKYEFEAIGLEVEKDRLPRRLNLSEIVIPKCDNLN